MANEFFPKQDVPEYECGQCFKFEYIDTDYCVQVVQVASFVFQLIDIIAGNRWNETKFDSVNEAVNHLFNRHDVKNIVPINVKIVEV